MDAATAQPRPGAGDGSPFDLPGGPDAALFLHGLTGSPFELRPLAEALCGAGMRCLGPAMAGHGGDPHALDGMAWSAWVEGARRELDRLAGARRTFLVGCSMGALAALLLARDAPHRVDALALLAPALELSPIGRLAGLVARRAPLAARLPLLPKGGSDVRDPQMRRRNPAMRALPISAVGELQRMQREVDRLLPEVRAPALVLAGGRDHTVTLRGARRVASRIGSAPARLVVLPESFHLVGIDVERERVAAEVAAFFAAIPARAGGEG